MITDLSPYHTALTAANEAGTLPPLPEFTALLKGIKPVVKPTTEDALTTLTFNPFAVPKDATIETLKKDLPMSGHCQTHLTTGNFSTSTPTTGLVQGSFLPMGKDWESEEGVDAVKQLALQTGRKIRLGTPEEFLAFKKQDQPHPNYCVSLAKQWNGHVLLWVDWRGGSGFRLRAWEGEWGAYCEVFVVEDL